MDDKLLSIVIPTKDRYGYLKSIIEIFYQFDETKTELIIQDNSSDNTEILKILQQYNTDNIRYYHTVEPCSMSANCDAAVANANGRYVCLMGDDDMLSPHLILFVEEMERKGIEVASFKLARYSWPGIEYKAHKFPSLIVPKFSGHIVPINAKRELDTVLAKGGTTLARAPQLYHGVVKRDVLDRIRNDLGTVFPGPSPDMAIMACLCYYATQCVYCDAPFISTGKSPKSAAGLGAKHRHVGELGGKSFLPPNLEERWNNSIPAIWTGPTIYAESLYEALVALGNPEAFDCFNYNYFFAHMSVFNPECKETVADAIHANSSYSRMISAFYRIGIFLNRCRVFAMNLFLVWLGLGAYTYKNIDTSADAERLVDSLLESRCSDLLN